MCSSTSDAVLAPGVVGTSRGDDAVEKASLVLRASLSDEQQVESGAALVVVCGRGMHAASSIGICGCSKAAEAAGSAVPAGMGAKRRLGGATSAEPRTESAGAETNRSVCESIGGGYGAAAASGAAWRTEGADTCLMRGDWPGRGVALPYADFTASIRTGLGGSGSTKALVSAGRVSAPWAAIKEQAAPDAQKGIVRRFASGKTMTIFLIKFNGKICFRNAFPKSYAIKAFINEKTQGEKDAAVCRPLRPE